VQSYHHPARQGLVHSQPYRPAPPFSGTQPIASSFTTPKQCSWLNQIELWLSILTRKLLRRASIASRDELKAKLLAFIACHNATMAKPFEWTYQGKPLVA